MDINKLLKIVLIVAIIAITGLVFYRYVIYIPQQARLKDQKEQQAKLEAEQEKQQEEVQKQALLDAQAKAAAEDKYWNDFQTTVQNSRTAVSQIRSQAVTAMQANRDWLNNVYAYKAQHPTDTELDPLINATEHWQTTLQKVIDSADNLNSIRYKILTAIEQQDSSAISGLTPQESSAVDTFQYWVNSEQQEEKDIQVIKTESIKNL